MKLPMNSTSAGNGPPSHQQLVQDLSIPDAMAVRQEIILVSTTEALDMAELVLIPDTKA
jgi:hypothetical protein